MLASAAYVFLAGYALFLLGFALFMYRENRKFGDNQFTVKLLPPPPGMGQAARQASAAAAADRAPDAADWIPVAETRARDVRNASDPPLSPSRSPRPVANLGISAPPL